MDINYPYLIIIFFSLTIKIFKLRHLLKANDTYINVIFYREYKISYLLLLHKYNKKFLYS